MMKWDMKQESGAQLARAVVSSNEDPEKKGRVQVEYPFLPTDNASIPSNWARISLPFASKENGMSFVPAKGDEVLVYFEKGNFESPIVIGCLYSGKNKVPKVEGKAEPQDPSDVRFMQTKSGHLLYFNDGDDAGLVLRDKEKRRLEISSKEKKITLEDDKQNGMVIEDKKVFVTNSSKDSVTLKDGSIDLKNKGGDQVEMKEGKISIKSSGGDQIEVGDSGIEVKGSGGDSIKITAGGITINSSKAINLGEGASEALLKGTTFMQLFNAHTHPHPLGQTAPPVPPLTPAVLSMKVKTV